MSLPAARRSALVDGVIDQLRTEISSGRWPVDTRIPPEAKLMEQLGVARGTLREAIRALSHAGLLQVRQGDGTYVRATTELAGAVERLGGDVEDVLEVRRALDPHAARLAAERISEAQLGALGELLERRAAAWQRRDRDAWIDIDADFHQAVANAAGNPLLSELYVAMTPSLRRAMAEDWHTPEFDGSDPRGHEGLLEALHAHDAEAAAESATANIDARVAEARRRRG
ncbi:FadR/GntR family transcriptional regulator [Yinghuangia soli]|uniref:FadR family transcriptional regulator n=1 Tax=Yinghuangia soli TaxID=2908204 RepID=A0AA41Q4D5_9ACTN|nr:FadR/GntR family transcriptional regulator [Yinghuangia soli]MCF2530481.1 FadR family transcriptional regulator [Yinghuangia soli]